MARGRSTSLTLNDSRPDHRRSNRKNLKDKVNKFETSLRLIFHMLFNVSQLKLYFFFEGLITFNIFTMSLLFKSSLNIYCYYIFFLHRFKLLFCLKFYIFIQIHILSDISQLSSTSLPFPII